MYAEKSGNLSVLENYFKKGDIVYPSAIARHYKISLKETYKLLDERKDVRKLYMINCLYCNCITSPKQYYAMADIDLTETGCERCDTLFTPKSEDILVLYEAKTGRKFPPVLF